MLVAQRLSSASGCGSSLNELVADGARNWEVEIFLRIPPAHFHNTLELSEIKANDMVPYADEVDRGISCRN